VVPRVVFWAVGPVLSQMYPVSVSSVVPAQTSTTSDIVPRFVLAWQK